ncbi:ATP-binding cassette domain-containing protein [bacterium]|nr:ATP-binding cassette domain-containing protein [bacterium]
MLRVDDIHFAYAEEPILQGVSLRIEGGVLGILGQSGCGKSTLLRVIAGLLRPDQGDIYVNEESLWRKGVKQRRRLSRDIGMVFQEGALFDFLNVRGNLEFALHSLRFPRSVWEENISEALSSVGLEDPALLSRFTTELSGGQLRRVGLARTLVVKPRIVLYDEPTTGLDPQRSRDICDMVRSNLHASKLAIIVSHDIRFIRLVCTEAILLERGSISARINKEGIEKLFSPPFDFGDDPDVDRFHRFIEGLPTRSR